MSPGPAAAFDRVHVVHGRRLVERRRYLEPRLAELGWDARWVESREPETLSPEFRRARVRNRRLTAAELSVYLKHLDVWREVAHHGGRAFVLEDDPVFPPGFDSTFATYLGALPATFDLVFFGASCGYAVAPAADNPRYGRENGARSMSAYLVTAAAARTLVDALDAASIEDPIDLAVNRVVRARDMVVYWSVPPLIENGTETGLFPHSLGVGWRASWLRRRLARWRERLRRGR